MVLIAMRTILQDVLKIFKDDKHVEDAEKITAQKATSLVVTGAASRPSEFVERELLNQITARKVPNVA